MYDLFLGPLLWFICLYPYISYLLLSNKLSPKYSFIEHLLCLWVIWIRNDEMAQLGFLVRLQSDVSQGCSHPKAQPWLEDLLPWWFSHMEPSSSPLGPLHRADWVVSQHGGWSVIQEAQSGSRNAFYHQALKSHISLLLPYSISQSHRANLGSVREVITTRAQVLGSVGHWGPSWRLTAIITLS